MIETKESINSIPRCDAIVVSVVATAAVAAATHAFEQQHSYGATRVTDQDQGIESIPRSMVQDCLRLPDAAETTTTTTTVVTATVATTTKHSDEVTG